MEYGHRQLVKKVIQVSDAEVAAGVTIGEIGLRVFAIEGHMQVMASQMVRAGSAGNYAAERDTDSTATDYGLRDKQSNGAHDGSPLTAIGQCIERQDWKFQLKGDIRSHPGEPIKVVNALSRTMLCALNVKERLCRFCEAMIWLRTLVEGLVAVDGSDGTERGYQGRYAGNPNKNNGWIEVDVPLLGELEVVADEPMVDLMVDEIVEPIVEAEEQMIALVVDTDEDIAMLFGNDDFKDDTSEGFNEEEVWKVNEEWLMAPVTPPSMLAVQQPSVYEVGGPSTAAAEGSSFPLPAPGLPVPPWVIEDLSTRLGNLEYEHGQLVKKVIQVSDAEVAAGIGEIGQRDFAI
ncbi:hypothetical protein Tco_0413401 [Tanacetum coccineum]